jgi:hypothetical protein
MVELICLYGLAYDCPHLERKVDCPIKEGEHLSFKEKVKWIDHLSEKEKETMLERHKVCTKNR